MFRNQLEVSGSPLIANEVANSLVLKGKPKVTRDILIGPNSRTHQLREICSKNSREEFKRRLLARLGGSFAGGCCLLCTLV